MREALTTVFQAGLAGQPLRQLVARSAELMLQAGLEEQLTAFLGRGPYERGGGTRAGYRNG